MARPLLVNGGQSSAICRAKSVGLLGGIVPAAIRTHRLRNGRFVTIVNMRSYEATIHLPGLPPRRVELSGAAVTVGRGSACDIPVADASLSRQHARLTRDGDDWFVEDLGSHNGTRLNGARVSGRERIRAGDSLELGLARLILAETAPRPLATGASAVPAGPGELDSLSLRTPAATLRFSLGMARPPAAAEALPILETLQAMSELTLELLNELPPAALYEKLLDKLFALLQPERGALLLRGKSGELEAVVTRQPPGMPGAVSISRTLIDAVVKGGEALLIDGRLSIDPVARAKSFSGGALRMALAAPLEHDGAVEGLIYLDAPIGRRVYSENDLRLVAALANVAAAKLQATRLSEEAQASRLLARDLTLAREIQRRLLPDSAPDIPGYALHGCNIPSRQVSGDLFNFLPRADGKLLLVIGDVCGKGIGPALLTSRMQTYLDAWSEFQLAPPALAAKLSTEIARRVVAGKFITAFFALLDPGSGTIDCCNAGHNPALLLRANGAAEWIGSHGPPLALLPDRSYKSAPYTLATGDRLLLYTDGITEAESPGGEEFGADRLLECLRDHAGRPPAEFEARINAALDRFTGDAPPHDDRTFVFLRRN